MAYGHGREFHYSPHLFESYEKWGIFRGHLLEPRVASEVPAESDLDKDDVASLAVESGRVRRGGVRDSSGVDEIGSCSLPVFKEGVPGLVW